MRYKESKEFKEFKEAIKNWGELYDIKTNVEKEFDQIKVQIYYADLYRTVVYIDTECSFLIKISYLDFNALPRYAKENLFKIVTDFTEAIY